MKVIILCVNYNSYNELNDYIQSIDESSKNCTSPILIDVVIVDNSKNRENFSFSGSINVKQIFTNKNLGYFGAIAFAINELQCKLNEYEYIIFSNVDLQVSIDFFSNLSILKIDKNVGCIAPKIFSKKEGINRNPKVINRYSLRKLKILKIMYRFPLLYYLYKDFFYINRRNKISTNDFTGLDIYAAHGSFMIFTKVFSSFLQTFIYPTFLFCEELFIAENLKKQELRTIYEPKLKIMDIDHASTSKMKSSFYFKCNFDSVNMIIKEFYNE